MASLPANVHVSQHPCVAAKMSMLRSQQTRSARDTKALVHEVALMVGCDALAKAFESVVVGTDVSHIGYEYQHTSIAPARITLMPILRSGLAMLDAIQTLLPDPVPVHHLGLFRDKATMAAVEYYNNLPYFENSTEDELGQNGPSDLAILIDPVIATGSTACAAIDTLRDWGVKKIIMISIISSEPGLRRAARQWPEGVEIWTGALDFECDDRGMIKPGLGDIGDRLFLTIGK